MPKRFRPPLTSQFIQVKRINLFIFLVGFLCLVLLIRLLDLQWIQYKWFKTQSLRNQMSITPAAAPRGIIVDRNGVVLADNMPMYVLEIIPEHVNNLDETLLEIQKLIPSISKEDITLFHKLRRQNRSFMPIALKMKLTQEEIATFAVNQYRFKGARIKAESLRYYPLGNELAHILGYVVRINVEELKELNPKIYQGSQFIVKTGIERYYEEKLRGKNGYEQVETDVNGRSVRVIERVRSHSGEKLTLTIDTSLQHTAFTSLDKNHGAVILMDVKTGEILAMVSTPSFDPNHFVSGISSAEYKLLSSSTKRPLFNRAIRGLYPPASTIKPFVAFTGLNQGVIDENTVIQDNGWYKLPNISHIYHDWYKSGHGLVNLKRAITVSCDPYFYNLGHVLGIKPIYNMLSNFGFGKLTNIDLVEETAGIVPNAEWKRKTKGLSWYPGDSLITAIGQGFMLVTPLQMAQATSLMARKGKAYTPHLLYSYATKNLNATKVSPSPITPISANKKQYWHLIHDAMHNVTTSDEGTGYRFGRNPPYSVAAKTGTAQVFGGKEYIRRLHQKLPKHLRDHSLFIAFAPVEDPKVAIAVVVEHDVIAAKVARDVLDAYFKLYPYEAKV